MIRNYQKTSGDSNVDLNPIYNSLQTINALLYKLDVQTTIPQAINSLSGAIYSLENDVTDLSYAVDSLEQRLRTLSFDNMQFITDTLLTTNITNYNTYYNTNLEIFEPYVQSITNYNYISAAYPNQRFNLPNATLYATNNDTNVSPTQISSYTLNKIDGGFYLLSNCVVNTVTNFNGILADCTVGQVYGDTIVVMGGKVAAFSCNSMGQVSLATIYAFTGSNCTIEHCMLDALRATSCMVAECTLFDVPWQSNSFKSMTLFNQNRFYQCGLTDCVVHNEQTTGYFSECMFSNVSFPYLNSTNFSKCSGTVYVPNIVNNSVLFDINGNYLYNERDYVTIYTEPSTYTNRDFETSTYTSLIEYTSTLTTNYYVTTDYTQSLSDTVISRVTTDTIISDQAGLPQYPTTTTIDLTVTLTATETLTSIATTIYTFEEAQGTTTLTGQWMTTRTYAHYYDSTLTLSEPYTTTRTLTDTISRTSTLTPQLLVKCLPEFNYQLPPNKLRISTSYLNTYVDINFIRNSTNAINIDSCTGNLYLDVNTVNTLCISHNEFNNMIIDVKNMDLSSFRYNAITNCTLNLYSVDAVENDIDYNEISNIVVNQYGPQTGFVFSGNVFYKAQFLAFTDDVTLSHIEQSYYTATFEGSNEFTDCTMTNITNNGTCNMRDCHISSLLLNNAATIRSCTIEKLIINPGVYEDFTIEENEIGTLICPEYMSDIHYSNMIINDTITY